MSRLTDGYLDEFGFRWVENARSGGSTYDPEGEGYPWRLILHTTETDNMPNTSTHQYPPQVWARWETREKIQTIPLTRAGYALYQSPWAPYYTNRARALQVEHVGRAASAADWPEERLRWLATEVFGPLCKFVEAVGGRVDLSDAAVPLPGIIAASAYSDAAQRLDPGIWARGPIGFAGHRHVPMGDDHWDAGIANMRRIRDYLVEYLGGSGYQAPIATQTKRKMVLDMDGKLRVNPDGTPQVFGWAGFAGGCLAYDFTFVPAGSSIAIHAHRPSTRGFNVKAVGAGGELGTAQLAAWGQPAVFPVRSNGFFSLIVDSDITPAEARAVAA